MSQKHRPLVIFGLGDFSDVISYIIESVLGLEISAYTLNATYMSSEHIRDLISSVQKFMQNMRKEMQSISLRKELKLQNI